MVSTNKQVDTCTLNKYKRPKYKRPLLVADAAATAKPSKRKLLLPPASPAYRLRRLHWPTD